MRRLDQYCVPGSVRVAFRVKNNSSGSRSSPLMESTANEAENYKGLIRFVAIPSARQEITLGMEPRRPVSTQNLTRSEIFRLSEQQPLQLCKRQEPLMCAPAPKFQCGFYS